jgi:hypothetical protein
LTSVRGPKPKGGKSKNHIMQIAINSPKGNISFCTFGHSKFMDVLKELINIGFLKEGELGYR